VCVVRFCCCFIADHACVSADYSVTLEVEDTRGMKKQKSQTGEAVSSGPFFLLCSRVWGGRLCVWVVAVVWVVGCSVLRARVSVLVLTHDSLSLSPSLCSTDRLLQQRRSGRLSACSCIRPCCCLT
jgi:Flp pilus assembly protein TadB